MSQQVTFNVFAEGSVKVDPQVAMAALRASITGDALNSQAECSGDGLYISYSMHEDGGEFPGFPVPSSRIAGAVAGGFTSARGTALGQHLPPRAV